MTGTRPAASYRARVADEGAPSTPARRTRGKRIDWSSLRAEYVEGITRDGKVVFPTYADIAERHKCNERGVEAKASAENWPELRAVYQRRVEQQRQDERAGEMARIAADLDLTALRMARDGMAVTHARIRELGLETQRRIEQLERNGTSTIDAADALELDRLSRASDVWYVLATKAIGMAPKQIVELELGEPLPDDARDEAATAMLAILREHVPHMVPDEVAGVIDVDGRVRIVAGDGEGGDVDAADAAG